MQTNEVRKKYLKFFEKRGHTVIPSASLVPENDSTTLFTGSGMQPLLPYLLGKTHPSGNRRLVDSQKCFRAEDIEEVGDNRHTTFFEMLGNWSLGDYWKEEQLKWFFEFLTEEIGIKKERLWATCFEGDKKLGIPPDNESAKIWKKLGIPEDRIHFYGSDKNWWSRSGVPGKMPAGEPGGPDSEVFYEFISVEHDVKFGKECHPNCDCGRFMEIGNCVFMQYIKQEDGSFKELQQKNVDFGGGLERITAASNNDADVFTIDVFTTVIDQLESFSGKFYSDPEHTTSFRIIADHIRAAVFMISDGVLPSNTESGYFARRLIRRSVRYADKLGIKHGVLAGASTVVVEKYIKQYPNLDKQKALIAQAINVEEGKFRKTLTRGLKEFEKIEWVGVPDEKIKNKKKGSFRGHAEPIITGKVAFDLYQTYGFPFELTKELAVEKGYLVDEEGFKKEMKDHQEISRKGAEQKFKGGLADTSEMSTKYHTATHLLHQALRNILGEHVLQKGSNITVERLRFDFSHDKKMTDDEKQEVEDLVNQKIKEAIPVTYEDVSLEEAKKLGALGLFEEKYGDKVSVYKIGDFSLECCGGPHVLNTNELGKFKIKKEEAVSSGVRRIKAILN